MPSIRDFSIGVVNQELQNRDTGSGVLFDCKNVLSSWNGELRKRTGTSWLRTLSEYNRIIPYRMPNGNDIMLLARDGGFDGFQFIGDDIIEPYYVFSGDAPTFPTTGWEGVTTNGDYTISLSSDSATSTWGKGFDTPTSERPMKYYNKGSHWVGGYESTTNVPAEIVISSEDAQIFQSACVRWVNTCNGNRTGHYKGWIEPVVQYSDDGTTWISVQTSFENPLPTGGADYYQASYHYGSGGSEKTENYTYIKVINVDHITPHTYWRLHFEKRIPNTQTYTGERIDLLVNNITYLSSTVSPLSITNSFFTAGNLDKIKYAQNDNLMILTNGTDNPLSVSYSAGAFTVQSYTTTLPVSQGTPNCVTFYQNRLWFGGFSAFPTRVWGSAFGNFTDFTIPSTVLSTSPISADSVEIQSIIENLWGGNSALYCLSADGVSMIDAQGGIVATDQIEFKLRNREPVDGMTPTYKDDIMVYLGRNQRKILITDYDYVVQRFKANNISINYDEWLAKGVRELHYIPNKASLIYGVLNDGNGFAILLNVDAGKNALFPIDTNGKMLDIQPIKYGNVTKLVIETQRNGQYMLESKIPQLDYERMDFMTKAEKESYTSDVTNSKNGYLDCIVVKNYDVATSTITDIPFAANNVVDVIADGYYIGSKTVSQTTGNPFIELTIPANKVILGYKYDSYAVLKFVSPYNLRKFPKEISVNFINTGYLEIGNSFNSLKSVLNNLVESVSISGGKILMNGNYTKTLDKQAFETPYVIVRSDKGLPFMITGIDYKVDMSNYQGGV